MGILYDLLANLGGNFTLVTVFIQHSDMNLLDLTVSIQRITTTKERCCNMDVDLIRNKKKKRNEIVNWGLIARVAKQKTFCILFCFRCELQPLTLRASVLQKVFYPGFFSTFLMLKSIFKLIGKNLFFKNKNSSHKTPPKIYTFTFA